MRIYDTLDVELSHQSYGSKWLCVLRGSEREIELAFNGLFNLYATNGDLTYTTGDKTVAIFWSGPEWMYKYFFEAHYMKWDSITHAHVYAKMKSDEFVSKSREVFEIPGLKHIWCDWFDMGTKCAEKPDADYKDEVLAHAFKDGQDAAPKVEPETWALDSSKSEATGSVSGGELAFFPKD